MTTDDARLVEIEAREQAATPAPWVDYDNVLGAHIIRAKDADIATVYVRYMVADARERDANAAFIAHSREDVRYLLDRLKAAEDSRDGFACDLDHAEERLKAAESRIRELEDEITYLVKVGRCGGNVSETDFDADGGFTYSNERSLPLGHTDFHADPKNEHPAEWSDWRTRLERPAIRVYEVQEEGNGG